MSESEILFRTTRCVEHDHPELTIRFASRPPVPNLERMLLGYFEDEVAKGTRFATGQIIQLGWAMLRIVERPDGTLGVEEPSVETESGWVESVEHSLMQAWSQREVAVSLGLVDQLAFPVQVQTAIVCERLLDGDAVLLARVEPDGESSGWFFGCTDETHDHNKPDSLSMAQLIGVAHRLPFVTQFLALPPGATVLIRGPGRIRATVWVNEQELTPRPGSYLEALNSEQGR
jgi:hypothetical protein